MFFRQIKKYSANPLVFILIILCSIIFCSCENLILPDEQSELEIIFPPDGYTISEGESVTLRANGIYEEPVWILSDEVIGRGYSLNIVPPPGELRLLCKTSQSKSAEQRLIVKPQEYNYGEDRFYLNTNNSSSLVFAGGEYFPFLVNLDDTEAVDSELVFDSPRGVQVNRFESRKGESLKNDNIIIRDISINIESKRLTAFRKEHLVSGESLKQDERSEYIPGMNKIFRFPDPFDLYNVTEVNAKLAYISSDYLFWIDSDDTASTDIEVLTSLFESAGIAEKTEAFWGEPLDIDDDNSIFILISSKINDTGSILGFFNPLDCFTFNDDEGSDDYNPCSNETDLVFAAVPDSENDLYSSSAIAATIAHELHHLIHFQRKTLRRLWSGELNAPHEELFLDEGLSHLQESLCGLGASGGNLMFVRRWLSDTPSYSLGSYDLDGSIDSAGKRGAMAAFLWYLFQEAGGADWSEPIPSDMGGISFLRNIVESRKTGWDVLTELTGLPKHSLLKNYAAWINRMRIEKDKRPSIIYDKITAEPITISPYLEEFSFSNNIYSLEGPALNEYNKRTAPEALCFFNDFYLDEKDTITIKQKESGIQSLWGFGMIPAAPGLDSDVYSDASPDSNTGSGAESRRMPE